MASTPFVDGIPRRKLNSRNERGGAPHRAVPSRMMKRKQRECIQFGNLRWKGGISAATFFPRPISNSTSMPSWKNALPARSRGVDENLAARDQRDSALRRR
jgi:hypothetical protein